MVLAHKALYAMTGITIIFLRVTSHTPAGPHHCSQDRDAVSRLHITDFNPNTLL